MRNLKIKKIDKTNVGYVVREVGVKPNGDVILAKEKEVVRTYLKQIATYLDTTLPESVKTYVAASKKLILAHGKKGDSDYKPGGLRAVEAGLVDEIIIRVVYGTTPEKFKLKEEVIVVARETYPVNFFRRMKRSSNILEYIAGLQNQFGMKEMKKDPKLAENVVAVDKYFKDLYNCLITGVVPMQDIKTT
jgi:hypothetical protein